MKKTAIGHVECPVCGFGDAEVKEDKNEHAFIFCTECNAQTFTRNAYRDKRLRARMRPVTVTEPAVETPPVPLPTEAPEPPVPAPQITQRPKATLAPQRAGWLQPMIGKR